MGERVRTGKDLKQTKLITESPRAQQLFIREQCATLCATALTEDHKNTFESDIVLLCLLTKQHKVKYNYHHVCIIITDCQAHLHSLNMDSSAAFAENENICSGEMIALYSDAANRICSLVL